MCCCSLTCLKCLRQGRNKKEGGKVWEGVEVLGADGLCAAVAAFCYWEAANGAGGAAAVVEFVTLTH